MCFAGWDAGLGISCFERRPGRCILSAMYPTHNPIWTSLHFTLTRYHLHPGRAALDLQTKSRRDNDYLDIHFLVCYILAITFVVSATLTTSLSSPSISEGYQTEVCRASLEAREPGSISFLPAYRVHSSVHLLAFLASIFHRPL